jgi:CoA:oxalate CoA-transferase
VFRAAQGKYVLLIAALEHQWQGLARAMGRPELATDPRFSDVRKRLKNKDSLIAEIERWLQSLPDRETALAALERERVPAAPVLTIPEVIAHPHLVERGTVRPMSDPVLGDFVLPGFPFRFSTAPAPDKGTAPDLGEHNRAVLEQYLKYDEAHISQLTASGILVSQRTPREEA